jgi:putative transposase
VLLGQIRDVFDRRRGVYGSPRIYRELVGQGIRCSLNRVARLMRVNRLRAAQAKRRRPRTTQSNHKLPVAANLLEQDFTVREPDRVWVSDITYIRVAKRWLYLAVVLDLGSRMVVGWSMSDSLSHRLALDSLSMAIRRRHPKTELIHHSDRGIQYASHAFQAALKSHGIRGSMSRKANCYDNAVAESFFHTLKVEETHRQNYRTMDEARSRLFDYIEVFYNRVRMHSTLEYKSPEEYLRAWSVP